MTITMSPQRLIVTAHDPQYRARLQQELLAADPSARVVHDLPIIDAFAIETGPAGYGMLRSRADLDTSLKVVADDEISIPEQPQTAPPTLGLDAATAALDVEEAWRHGIRGKGIGVAVIDSGVVEHKDLKGRLIGFKDIEHHWDKPHDEVGHGTHVAGIIAGSGRGSNGQYVGVAPQADIIGVRVMNELGKGTMSDIVAGIQWAVDNREKYHIRVLNLSLGGRINESWKDDPLVQAVEAATAAGIVACIAAGNRGPEAETISSPGNAPSAITAGAFDDKGTGPRRDDEIAKFSSRGPTLIDGLPKPDVVAPGVKITAANAKGGYITYSGTSMASPMVAGCVALLLQARPDLTPQQVKDVLTRTATPMPALDPNAQGAGVVNPVQALKSLGAL